ncbi:MAG: AAA family ATPase, partial [Thermoproteus sp.]
KWDVGKVLDEMLRRGLMDRLAGLSDVERGVLREALEDPDALFYSIRKAPGLVDKLIEWSLIARVYGKDPYFWIDAPPPERDPELGVGKYYAWQTPLHREAVRRALGGR